MKTPRGCSGCRAVRVVCRYLAQPCEILLSSAAALDDGEEKLLNFARARNDDFGLILTKYGLERVLFRISNFRVFPPSCFKMYLNIHILLA